MNSTEFYSGLYEALYDNIPQGGEFLSERHRAAFTGSETLTGSVEEMTQADLVLQERVAHERAILEIVGGYFEQGSEMPRAMLLENLRGYCRGIGDSDLRVRLFQILEMFEL